MEEVAGYNWFIVYSWLSWFIYIYIKSSVEFSKVPFQNRLRCPCFRCNACRYQASKSCIQKLLQMQRRFFPKATAKGSFEKSTTIKDCRSDRCLERLPSKTTEVIRVLKDCHQRLPKWWLCVKIVIEDQKRLMKWCLSWKTVIKDCRSDPCLERLSSKTTEVMAVLKECHQRLPKWWLSWKTVTKDYRSDGCL